MSLCRTTAIRQAWHRGQAVDVHGWIYGVDDGLLRDLDTRVSSMQLITCEADLSVRSSPLPVVAHSNLV